MMPEWIHARAEHLLAKNPSMAKSTAFAIATRQSHAKGKSPKVFGTSTGKQEAKEKYDKPKKEYEGKANPGKLTSPKLAFAFFDELHEILKTSDENIVGGKADGKTDDDFPKEQMEIGKKVEMEHTNNPALAAEISRDHLTEFQDYYTRLKKMEAQAEKEAGVKKLASLLVKTAKEILRAEPVKPAKAKGASAEEGYFTQGMQRNDGGALPKNASAHIEKRGTDQVDAGTSPQQGQPEPTRGGGAKGLGVGLGVGATLGTLGTAAIRRGRGAGKAVQQMTRAASPAAEAATMLAPRARAASGVQTRMNPHNPFDSSTRAITTGERTNSALVGKELEALSPDVRSQLQSRGAQMPGMTENAAYQLMLMGAQGKKVPIGDYIKKELASTTVGGAAPIRKLGSYSFFDELFKIGASNPYMLNQVGRTKVREKSPAPPDPKFQVKQGMFPTYP